MKKFILAFALSLFFVAPTVARAESVEPTPYLEESQVSLLDSALITSESEIPEIPSELSSYSNIVIAECYSNKVIYLLATNAENLMIRYGDSTICAVTDGEFINGPRYTLVDGAWVYQKDTWGIPGTSDETYIIPTVYYNSVPIYKQDSSSTSNVISDEMVFQLTSHIRHPNQTLVGGVDPKEVVTEILSLVPYLIPCLVGYLGLRKGLAILLALLHQS